MAWTTLGTVAPGDVLRANSGTAAYNNVIENLNVIGGAWTSFTPSWTNLTVGTGGSASNTGHYMNAGKLYIVRTRTVLGSSGFSVGTNPQLTLPNSSSFSTAAAAAALTLSLGIAAMLDSATATYWASIAPSTSTRVEFRLLRADTAWLSTGTATATVPMTWAASDEIVCQFMYEAA
jgi:hypothetical protein